MARSFNLTAELNLRGPANIRNVVGDIRRQLNNITVDITPRINQAALRNVTALNGGLGQLNTTLNTTATSANNAASSIQNLSRAIASIRSTNISQTVNNAANSVQTLTANANSASTGLQQATNRMEEFGRQSALAVRRFAAFSIVTSTIYGFINALNKGVDAFIQFDKEFVRLQQVTDSSAKGLQSLAAEITRLSTGLGVASSDLTTVAVTLAQAGLSAKETKTALSALAKSALAPSFDDLNSTVEGSIALMRQFGIGANDLESALGSVNAVAAKFAVEASDLITAIQRTGGVFATASKGVSEGKDALNEFLAVFTSIRQTTRESAETIATGLRTIFTRIQRQSTIDALQGLGIELRNVDGQFVGAYEAVRRLSEGLSRIDPRSREFAAIAEELGGFRQIGKVIPLIQQFAVAQQALKVAQQGQGSLANDTATAQLSLANQMAKVREEFLALIRSIGDSDSFRSFVKLSLDLASALIRLADSAKNVLPALTAIAAFKGISALTQFGRGFGRGLGGGRGYASGGYVPGTGNRDTVPAMLTPGEFVIRKKAVQAIGVDKLQSMNKYGGGGRIKRYAKGGMTNAPMVDDITQTTGSILPKPSAVDSLIRAGGGAVDIDRTLKRTLGDKAYAKAATPASQQQVLGKYFTDEAARLQDVKSAPLTGFGKALQEAIKSGQLKGSRVSIISKSRRTKGVPEYLSQLFGIPVANMVFTQGGTKQPAMDAIRAKGPRAGRIAQRFALGGMVGDIEQGWNRKLGAAILEQGDFPDKTANISTQTLFGSVGASDLLKAGTNQSVFAGQKSLSFKEIYQGLSPQKNQVFQNNLDKYIVKGVNSATTGIARDLKLPRAKINQDSAQHFLDGINKGTRGNLFEEILFNLNNANATLTKSRENPDAPFDFPFFNNQLLGGNGEYTNLPNKWVDAKATYARARRDGGLTQKAFNQIQEDLQSGINSRQLIRVQTAKQVKEQAKQAGKQTKSDLVSALKQQYGSGNLESITDPKTRTLVQDTLAGGVVPSRPGATSTLRSLLTKRAKGGSISGEDTVPALLTPGEFVINKKAASRLGASRLHSLNRADKITGYNSGGVVQRFFGGGGAKSPGNAEARIQKIMMTFEKMLDQVQKAQYAQLRSQGMGAKEAHAQAKHTAIQQLTTTSSAIRAAGGTNIKAGANMTEVQTAAGRVVANKMGYGPGPSFAERAQGRAASYSAKAQLQKPSVGKDINNLMAGFNTALASASVGLTKLTSSSTYSAQSLKTLGMNALKGTGKGISSAISGVGGTVLSAVGLGGLSTAGQQPGSRFAAGRKAVAARRAGGGGGGMGGMGGMVATMAGGAIVDSASQALGGEKTESGRMVGSMGSNALNYGAMGAMIGSVIPGVGTALGALTGAAIGLTVGFFEAKKAGEEYAQSQREAAAEKGLEASGKAIETYGAKGTASSRAQAIAAMGTAFKAEEAAGAGAVKRQSGETAIDFAARKAETQQKGAAQAEQFLAMEMTKSGKTFTELSKSMDPSELAMLTKNIAEADKNYVVVQEGYNKEIQAAKDAGDPARAAQIQARADKELATLAMGFAERKLAEESAAIQAQQAANANARLTMAVQASAMTLETAFDKIGQVLSAASFETGETLKKGAEIFSGQVSLTSGHFDKISNVLENPEAFSPEERKQAMRQGASVLGPTGATMARMAEFGRTAQTRTTQSALSMQASGAQNPEIIQGIRAELTKQINDSFGAGTPLAEQAIRDMNKKLDTAAAEAGNGLIDVAKVVGEATEPLVKVSEGAAKQIANANKFVAESLKAIAETASQAAQLQDKINQRTAKVAGMQAQSRLKEAESLGIETTTQDKMKARTAESASLIGLQSGQAYNAENIVQRRRALVQQQTDLKSAVERLAPQAATNPAAARQMAEFQNRLQQVNQTISHTDQALEDLPQVLEESIGDVMGEMQKRVSQLEAKKEAGAGFAEKLITSTPKELADLNRTYALLNNTLRGNITTINDSQTAQKAYFEALRSGKTQQEAMSDAQSAFAEENKKAFSMFQELTQVAGLEGAEVDRQRAKLIENMARATGQGNNQFIQSAIKQLRASPEERAARDPRLAALRAEAAALRQAQTDAMKAANDDNITKMEAMFNRIIPEMANAMRGVQQGVANAGAAGGVAGAAGGGRPAQRNSKGGLIYAADGTLVNFQPKGTDTVPAMLTPGEFVVNRKATRNNLGLLQSINSGNYATGGVVGSSTPTLDQNVFNQSIRGFSSQLGSMNKTLKNVDQNSSYVAKEIKQNESTGLSSGGIVYASGGKLINFKSKGTDTVPAMLTPGEFVVNRQATKDNLGLLQSINGGAAQGYSHGGVVYLQGGGRAQKPSLISELGGTMSTEIQQAIADAQSKNTWIVLSKGGQKLPRYNNGSSIGDDLSETELGIFENLSHLQNMAQVVATDRATASNLLAEKYHWYDPDRSDYPFPLYKFLTDGFKKLIAKTKSNKAYFFREAYNRELVKFPQLFEVIPNSIPVRGGGGGRNPDAFADDPIDIDASKDNQGRYISEFGKKIDNINSRQQLHQMFSDRANLLRQLQINNRTAEQSFQSSGLNSMNPYATLAGEQIKYAGKELNNINNIYAKFSELRRLPQLANPYTKTSLFDPNAEAVNMNAAKIVNHAKHLNRGGVVYASNGKLINFKPKGTDTVPAMLTPGEFVVNRQATQDNLPLLRSINSGNYANGGVVYLANGTDSPLMKQAREQERLDSLERQRQQAAVAREQEMARRRKAYQDEMSRRRNPQQAMPAAQAPAQQNNQAAGVRQNVGGGGFLLNVGKEVQDFMNAFSTKIDNFGKYIDNLAGIKLPEKIDFNFNAAPLEVRITGAAALESMSDGIQKLVATEVNKEMNRLWNQTDGEIGKRPG